MRRPAIESTPPRRLPAALAPSAAAPVTLAAALLVLAVLAAPALAGTGRGDGPAGPGQAGTEVAGRLVQASPPAGDPTTAQASPVAGDPTTAQLARRLDRETARLHEDLAAAMAAQRATEDLVDQARFLAAGGLIVGLVGLIVAALAWGRQTPASDGVAALPLSSPAATLAGRPATRIGHAAVALDRSGPAPSSRSTSSRIRTRSPQLPRRP
jgi:hypothetical protein